MKAEPLKAYKAPPYMGLNLTKISEKSRFAHESSLKTEADMYASVAKNFDMQQTNFAERTNEQSSVEDAVVRATSNIARSGEVKVQSVTERREISPINSPISPDTAILGGSAAR